MATTVGGISTALAGYTNAVEKHTGTYRLINFLNSPFYISNKFSFSSLKFFQQFKKHSGVPWAPLQLRFCMLQADLIAVYSDAGLRP